MTQQTTGASGFKRSLSIFLVIVFAGSTVFAVLAFNAEVLLLNPDTYKKAVNSQGIYSRLPGLIAQQLMHTKTYNACADNPANCAENNLYFSTVPTYMQILDTAGWEYILTLILPQQWLKVQGESLIDQFFAALKENNAQQLVIASGELRATLTENHYRLIAQALLATAAPCSNDELNTLANIDLGQSSQAIPVCIPTEELRPVIETEVQALLVETAQTIPDQIGIDLAIFPEPQESGSQDPSQGFRNLRLAFLLSPLLPITLLAVIALINGRSWSSLLLWWGIPLLSGGLLVLILAALMLPVVHYGLNSILIPLIPGVIDDNLVQVLASVFQNIANRYTFWIGLEAGGLFLTGGGMILFSFITRWKAH